MGREAGFIESGAVAVLFFLAAVTGGGLLLVSVHAGYVQSNEREFAGQTDAGRLAVTITGEMQALAGYDCDYPEMAFLTDICLKYAAVGLLIEDVSSGYHLDFLSDADLADTKLASFLFRSGSAAGFKTYRAVHGFSTSIEPLKEFIKDELQPYCVVYGWIPVTMMESYAFKTVSAEFGTSNPEDLFPLVNHFPLMNINMIDPEIIRPLVTREAFKIKKAEEKLETLIGKARAGPLLASDIASLLEIPATHELFAYIGTKTAFWKLRFVTGAGYRVEAVVAALPRKNGMPQEIESYTLIDRSIWYGR